MDVDSLILQREAMSLLHEIVLASARIYGAEAFLADSKYERLMRDVTTLMSSALYVRHACACCTHFVHRSTRIFSSTALPWG